MKDKQLKRSALVFSFVFCALMIAAPPTWAGGKVTAEKVKKETAEAVEAAQDYASQEAGEKREDFSKKMKANMDEIDRQIGLLKQDLKGASAEVRRVTSKKIAALENKRETLNEKYDAFEKTTDAAWKKLRNGLEKAWTDVKAAYDDAKTELRK